MKTTCHKCDKSARARYVTIMADGTIFGEYCSKKCAIADFWGPMAKKATIKKKKKPLINKG